MKRRRCPLSERSACRSMNCAPGNVPLLEIGASGHGLVGGLGIRNEVGRAVEDAQPRIVEPGFEFAGLDQERGMHKTAHAD